MAIIGAVTRLTESGLSIVEWRPVTGALPPLSEAAWQREYDLYQQSPQGQIVNAGMSMDDFKWIYFWEWLHRLWGRMIGVVYALPLLWFWRDLPRASRPAFLGLLALGGLQGVMGWYMVQSGLVDQPMVSHYRLAAHLLLAAVIFVLLLRMGASFRCAPWAGPGDDACRRLRRWGRGTLALVLVTLVWGAFVAGLRAGLFYNTFPMMDAHWIPPELLRSANPLRAFFSEPASVQFAHRLLALVTVVAVLWLWHLAVVLSVPPSIRRLAKMAAAAVLLQAGLGIATLLTQVNIVLATLHQGGAFVLLGVMTVLLYHLNPQADKGRI